MYMHIYMLFCNRWPHYYVYLQCPSGIELLCSDALQTPDLLLK